jgi:peroxiredoxin
MSLYNALAALRVKYAKILKPGLTAIMDNHVEHLRADGTLEGIIKVGEKAPSFELKDGRGNIVRSADLLRRGPLVVSFYRGSWCPYCVEEVKALNKSYKQIKEAGAELVVISPQGFVHTEKQQTGLELQYSLLVDQDNQVAKEFRLVYSFPQDLKDLYLNTFKNDLAKHNETSVWELPIPARIVIDQEGIVRDVKADPDYRFRPEPSDSVEVLRGLGA